MKADYINDVEKVLLSEEEIKVICKRLGEQISCEYKGKDLLLVGLLKGSVVFIADLMREINIPCKIDFMDVSSYGAGTVSSGVVTVNKDLEESVVGKDILIVEDILESGRTLKTVVDMLKERNPESVKVCTLLNKPEGRKVDFEADYVGAVIPDEFVIGYGLDYNELYRNLPFVGVLKRSVYENN
jgi:hypoxanthine phosphoribosyltransferase